MQPQKLYVLVGREKGGSQPLQSLIASFSVEKVDNMRVEYQNTHEDLYIEEMFLI